jgi:shikimate dehydrogenase
MDIIGIVALKLNHSLSHVIHNYWIAQGNTKFQFKKYELKENEIDKFINKFRKDKKFKGFNITIPYKEKFLNLCDSVSPRARKIGSVNLVYKKNNLIFGDNTDVIGFSRCYKFLKLKNPKSVLLIGAGGAARSVLYYLNYKNVENIDIFAPSLKRKQGLSSDFKFRKFVNNTSKLEAKYELIINASSAGMVGSKRLNRNIFKLVKRSKGVIDIVYNPIQTDLLQSANNFKIKNIGGLKMLLEQAKPSFERWTNKKVEIDDKLAKKIEAILK